MMGWGVIAGFFGVTDLWGTWFEWEMSTFGVRGFDTCCICAKLLVLNFADFWSK